MNAPRVLLAVAAIALAVLLEVSVLAPLHLPGATPDLVLLAVVAFALVHGPGFGAGVGFGAGLAMDLVPPADAAAGRWAFTLSLVGYLAGFGAGAVRRSALASFVVVGVAAAAALLLYAGLGAIFDDPGVSVGALLAYLPSAILYDLALTPFVVLGILTLARAVEPDPERI